MPMEIYTDGSCLRNPGPGGYSFIIRYWKPGDDENVPEPTTSEFKQGYRLTTNNRMEVLGGIEGLKKAAEGIKNGDYKEVTQLNLYSDSEYLCNAVNQKWIDRWYDNNWMTSGWKGATPQPVKNKDLWEQLVTAKQELQKLGVNVVITWVKGHDENQYNNRADTLAVEASHDSTNHLIDTKYEETSSYLHR
jgi:ribonuclease HI